MQVMVACGPFTVSNELSYEPLKDLMSVVKREEPNVLILCGPFVNQTHEDIQSGDLKYSTPDGYVDYLDYDILFQQIFNYVSVNVPKHTKVLVVPNTNDITHIYPLPQPPFGPHVFDKLNPSCLSNPCHFELNEVSIGLINTDVVKDMCSNIVVKNPVGAQAPKSKIEIALESILEQKSFYPLYPGNQVTPIEWEQWEKLQMHAQPDILIVPSDLIVYAKVSNLTSLTILYRTFPVQFA